MQKNFSKVNGNYPKILIIGRYFVTGPGDLTLNNLFKGWDKCSLAVAALNIQNPNFDICNNYYQLGSLEDKRNFPFNLIEYGRGNKSGLVVERKQEDAQEVYKDEYLKYKMLYHRFSDFFGLSYYRKRFHISDQFLHWIQDFSPDYIYSQLSTLEDILFIDALRKQLSVPIAIHIMDDWPSTIVKKGILSAYWRKIVDENFRQLLRHSKILMSISESMSVEYKERYGYDFIPFHNPIEIDFWQTSQNDTKREKPFIILYAGRLGLGIRNCFYDITEAIESLSTEGLEIELHIQVVNYNSILDDLAKFQFVKLNKAIPYDELPNLLAKVSLLIIPNDFDQTAISFLKFSMPTKASEYMASGTPILVYSSIENAITKHALAYKWAFVVSEQDPEILKNEIRRAYENDELRNKFGTTAKKFATEHFDSNIVRTKFKEAFNLPSIQ